MRLALALLLLATPAAAWDFTPVPVCTLSHATQEVAVTVTFDPRQPQAYSLTATADWPDAPVFAIRFDGPRGLTISTGRHVLSDGGRRLTVTDTGFTNVLDGLEFNTTATLLAGDRVLAFSLDGAGPEVRRFRDCADGGLA